MTASPGLHVVATPIGNLGDITYRAVEILKGVDVILCEDTRHTARLCAAYDIRTPRQAYHEHNAAAAEPDILRRLAEGARMALVSDAGTPLISDPGQRLVRAARSAGLPVFPAPGPSAAIAALSAAGVSADRFLFVGFPPPRSAARRTAFQEAARVKATLVFYESPQRLAESLSDMAAALGGERRATVARELTKLHEEFRTGTLDTLAAEFGARDVKGEIVVIVEPPAETAPAADDLDALLAAALETMPVRDAAGMVAAATGLPRRDVYRRALDFKADKTKP